MPLLTLDPDLAGGLEGDRLQDATAALQVRVAGLGRGLWRPPLEASQGALGLLILDGVVVRETRCGVNCSAELLGSGDVIRPWQGEEDSLIDPEAEWYVADDTRVAVLDESLGVELARWPSVAAEVFGRSLRRVRALSVQRAIAQVRRLDQRTLLYLWHVGERFGRVTAAGIVVRLPLTHERLATLVGAHRPSLTSALSKLERSRLLVRDSEHELVLTPEARGVARELAGRIESLAA